MKYYFLGMSVARHLCFCWRKANLATTNTIATMISIIRLIKGREVQTPSFLDELDHLQFSKCQLHWEMAVVPQALHYNWLQKHFFQLMMGQLLHLQRVAYARSYDINTQKIPQVCGYLFYVLLSCDCRSAFCFEHLNNRCFWKVTI